MYSSRLPAFNSTPTILSFWPRVSRDPVMLGTLCGCEDKAAALTAYYETEEG